MEERSGELAKYARREKERVNCIRLEREGYFWQIV